MSIDSTALSTAAQQVFEAAMQLPDAERAKLADKLSSTIDPISNQEWQDEWAAEIDRRVRQADDGTAKLLDWHDVRQKLWEGIDGHPNS